MKNYFINIIQIGIILLLGGLVIYTKYDKQNTFFNKEILILNQEILKKQDIIDSLKNLESIYVIGTKYNAVKEQCDDTPLITANNTKIDTVKLNSYELRYVALSRDLFKIYDFNDSIHITSNNPNLNGYWVIKDKMASRYINRIDFLVPLKDTLSFNEPLAIKLTL